MMKQKNVGDGDSCRGEKEDEEEKEKKKKRRGEKTRDCPQQEEPPPASLFLSFSLFFIPHYFYFTATIFITMIPSYLFHMKPNYS